MSKLTAGVPETHKLFLPFHIIGPSFVPVTPVKQRYSTEMTPKNQNENVVDSTKQFLFNLCPRNSGIKLSGQTDGSIKVDIGHLVSSIELPHNRSLYHKMNDIYLGHKKYVINQAGDCVVNYNDTLCLIELDRETEICAVMWEQNTDNHNLSIIHGDTYTSKYIPCIITHFTTNKRLDNSVGTIGDSGNHSQLFGKNIEMDIVCVKFIPGLTPKTYNECHSLFKAPKLQLVPSSMHVDEFSDYIYFKFNPESHEYEFIGTDDSHITDEYDDYDDRGLVRPTSGADLIFYNDTNNNSNTLNYALEQRLFEIKSLKLLNHKSINEKYEETKKIWEEWAGIPFEADIY